MPTDASEKSGFEIGAQAVERTLPEFFEEVAADHGDRPALLGGTWEATYAQLNDAANHVAAEILARGGELQDRVAILMRHDTPMLAAILGTLKAGRVVVVLNGTDPATRLGHIVADAEPGLVITDAAHEGLGRQLGAAGNLQILGLESLGFEPRKNLRVKISPAANAFLIYTSGSTGRPKGVIQTHRNIIHNMYRNARGLGIHVGDRLVLLASPSGGQGLGAVWCALLCGAALCPFPMAEKGVTGLAEWMNRHRITLYVSAASVFRHFMQTLEPTAVFPAVRTVRLASESATADDFSEFVRHFADSCSLLHTLSSSETGNITQSLMTKSTHVEAGRLSVGRAVPGVDILLVDAEGKPVPAGEVGEVAVQSAYLSPGYWRQPELTAQRFFEAADKPGQRIYRSGDRARMDADGTLVYSGRADNQIKIHGFRVELSDIEKALSEIPQVGGAAVCAVATGESEPALHAFVVREAGSQIAAEEIRRMLRQTLPPHMVPSQIHFLESLPLSAQGKVDREKLRSAAQALRGAEVQDSNDEPRTPMEALLADIWESVLKNRNVGRDSDFFSLGGDSLSATVIAARVYAASGRELDLRKFSESPKLMDLAAHLEAVGSSASPHEALMRVDGDSELPLSFSQERIWRYSRTAKASAGYIVACSHLLRGALNVEALREAITFLHAKHEMLRTTFSEIDGRPVQRIHEATAVVLPVIDFSLEHDPEKRAEAFFQEEAGKPFDLGQRPLLRFHLIKLRENEYWLLRIYHHVLADAWSWGMFFRELGEIYAKICGGNSPELAPRRIRYADYAAWQRATLNPEGAAYRATLDWWQATLKPRAAELKLPFRRWMRSPRAKARDGLLWWGVEGATSERLEKLARARGATYYMIRLAAFMALLARTSGQRDVVVGTYVTNRTRVETQSLFGFFANLATLRVQCDLAMPFADFLCRVRAAVADIQSHAEIPYESLANVLRERGVAVPAIRAVFSVSDHTSDTRMGEVMISRLDRRMEAMPWGFTLNLDVHHETARNYAAFDARLYHPRHVGRFVERYKALLDRASRDPERRLDDLLG